MNHKILVVDSSRDTKELYISYFKKKYDFIFVFDGESAIKMFNTTPDIEIIITDIGIPKLDGISMIKELNKYITFQKIIISSFYGDLDNIRLAMNLGAYDFLIKPINFDDLETVIKKTVTLTATLKNNINTQTQFDSISRELSSTAFIQKSILPGNSFKKNKLSIYAENIPAFEVGGDFYDFFEIDNVLVGFTMADVSGKNISAAIFMTMAKTLIKSFAKIFKDPAECMCNVNKALCSDNNTGMFVTCLYGVINTLSREMYLINCGHMNPILISKNSNPLFLKTHNNLALGISDDLDFSTKKITLPEDSFVLAFTDGVIEAINSNNIEYQYDRLFECIKNHHSSPKDLISAIILSIKNFTEGCNQFDDITMLCIHLY